MWKYEPVRPDGSCRGVIATGEAWLPVIDIYGNRAYAQVGPGTHPKPGQEVIPRDIKWEE